jgi:hypothetical protein
MDLLLPHPTAGGRIEENRDASLTSSKAGIGLGNQATLLRKDLLGKSRFPHSELNVALKLPE